MNYQLKKQGDENFILTYEDKHACCSLSLSHLQLLRLYADLKKQFREWDEKEERVQDKKRADRVISREEYYCYFWRTWGTRKSDIKTYREIAKYLGISPEKAAGLYQSAERKRDRYIDESHPKLHNKLFNEFWDRRRPDRAPHNYPDKPIPFDEDDYRD